MFVLSALASIAILLVVPVIIYWCLIFFKFQSKLNGKIPRLPTIPIFGTAHFFKNPITLYHKFLQFRKQTGRLSWCMLGFEPVLLVMDADLLEIILSSSKIIDKSGIYRFLHSWLGTGLLTSTGDKWRKHRKILTPAFHFKILEDFIPSFDSASDILVDVLEKEVGEEWTDIFPYITLCTLDSVCESAMGTTVNAQRDTDSVYIRSVKEMCRIIIDRIISIPAQFEFTYKFTKDYRLEKDALKVLHGYTNSVIKKRKEDLLNEDVKENDDADVGIKRRRAFLDLLLEYSSQGNRMSDTDIREEVDTFMFEGHDTTAAAVTFCLYLLSRNRACQGKVFEEIKEIFADDRERKATLKDLQDMKYLDLVLKETLRLLPSVPFFGRELTEDLMYGDILIPKGISLLMLAYVVHLDPEYFPEPHVFRPERFLNEERRSPFSYIPFSAGPRNCIGQKFAILSMKSTISKVLRRYDFHPVDYDMKISAETILRSRNGVRVQIKYRQW